MPIYEFRCEGCQNVFEHLALTSGEMVQVQCPACGGSELARVMSTCASMVSGSQNAPGQEGPSLQNRSCANAGNCSTLTLPGPD